MKVFSQMLCCLLLHLKPSFRDSTSLVWKVRYCKRYCICIPLTCISKDFLRNSASKLPEIAEKVFWRMQHNFMIIVYLAISFMIIRRASKYCCEIYNETLPARYKQYGNEDKPCLVVIPGLDGATSFFHVRI